MWKFLSTSILKHKLYYTTGILLLSAFMAYQALHMELSYEFAKILPDNDSTFIQYQEFKKQFGEDGNVMVIGFEDKNLYEFNKFRDWHLLSQEVKEIQGVRDLISVSTVYNLKANDSLQKFEFIPVVPKVVRDQAQVDSIKEVINNLPFYDGFVFNKETGATLMAITFKKKDLDSERRLFMAKEIKRIGENFATKYNLQMHYSGMPYIRSELMTKVRSEMTLFLGLAVLVTAFILWMFFRSFTIVLYSVIVVVIGVVWSIGIMQLFGYKITVMSGLIAPLIMVIGLPNCIFLINKYQAEFLAHGNRVKALQRAIETIGITLFLANITTAIGFGVLYFTKSSMLVEFGVVAAISVMVTYFITLIMIPIILHLLPPPKAKHMRHQEGKRIRRVLDMIDALVQKRRIAIYIITTVITGVSIWGMTYVDMNGYVVDDLPSKDPVYEDLHFFEKHFKGVLPFEISIDTRKKNGLLEENARALYKIRLLEKMFAQYDEFSKPISIVEGLKFSYQAYKGGDAKYYKLPSVNDLKALSEYNGSIKGQGSKLQNFVDSTRQITRISYQATDIGSKRMKALMAEIKPRIDSIFDPKEYTVNTTGHSLVFLKSNDYLLSNLLESLVIEVVLIAIVGIALFRSVRIILLSKLPALIPLVITAGIMGFLDIRFKPSTILIFSIAFGISSDGTIYFLTKYRHELKKLKKSSSEAISTAIQETGLSMIYTSVILFCGFAIFTASSFGGTAAMGILVSLTLVLSMFTNLILLPAILLSIHSKAIKKEFEVKPYIDISEEENERSKGLD
jgi:predicted RND superfamily exporter protein